MKLLKLILSLNMFANLEDIKKGIPEYADAIIHEITKAKTKDQIKTMLSEQLKQYLNQTVETQTTSQMNRILLRTESRDIESARIKLNKAISVKHDLIVKEAILLIFLSVILFTLSGFSRQSLSPSRYILLVLFLIILLIAGVTTPMIDMEAKNLTVEFCVDGAFHPF